MSIPDLTLNQVNEMARRMRVVAEAKAHLAETEDVEKQAKSLADNARKRLFDAATDLDNLVGEMIDTTHL